MAQYLESRQWASNENLLAFSIIENLQSIINTQFGGDSSVHIGFIYIAVGLEAGQVPRRYIIHIPFYNPTQHGYNFSFACPFTFARGFAGVASSEYYVAMQDEWDIITKDITSLSSCSPILLTEVEVKPASGFQYRRVRFTKGEDDNTVKAGDTKSLECWIHGARAAAGKSALDEVSDDRFKEIGAAIKSFAGLPKGSLEKDEKLGKLKEEFLDVMKSCNSASYPTMQIAMMNPMDGFVPFPVNNLRLSISETGSAAIDTSERTANDVHIIVAPPTYVQRFISFSIVWNRVLARSSDASGLEKNKKRSARFALEKVIRPD